MHACCPVLPNRDFRKRRKSIKTTFVVSEFLGRSRSRHRIISFNLPPFLLSATLLLLHLLASGRKGWRMTWGGALPWPRRIRGRFPENLARTSARAKRHFIKNKFREGVDGYPGASRGFDAADSPSHSFSLYLSCSSFLPFSIYARLSIIRRTFLVCLVNILPAFSISFFHFHCVMS